MAGRPKDHARAVKALAPLAVETLEALMRGDKTSDTARIAAIREVLDRAQGKAKAPESEGRLTVTIRKLGWDAPDAPGS